MIRLLSPLVRQMMVLFASKKSGVGIIQGLLDWFSSLLPFFGMQSFTEFSIENQGLCN